MPHKEGLVPHLKRVSMIAAVVVGSAWFPPRAPAATSPSVALASENAAVFSTLGGAGLDDPATGRIPNYLRALAATHPDAVLPFARLVRTVLYGGTIAPETKAAMGLLIAKQTGSGYLSAHMSRLLKTTERGQALLRSLAGGPAAAERERIALRYAEDLTRAVHGVGDAQFAQARAVYNDAQLVELTAVTCFFNDFARFCQGTGLSLELWAKEAPNALPAPATEADDDARVTLASDAELQMAAQLAAPSPELKRGLGIGIANSQRAMLRVPDIAAAWFGYMRAVQAGAKLPRETLLQISFAVSMANGCRYCTLHQVVGLRRLGVEPAKLLAMQRDDSVLTPRERAAVTFARKLTKAPGAVRETDFAALRGGLGDDSEAMDALLQICTFNFMNRFTDGLRLPSEDEAVRVYQQVYGDGSYRAFPRGEKSSGMARR
jgi:uncharacterized peroxidase-related enzyme